MTTKNKCRAKNPGSCRVHGSSNAVDVITNDKIARRNLFESMNNLDKVDSVESYFEASEQVAHDQKAYDATLTGIKALTDDLESKTNDLTSDQFLKLGHRLANAMEYRKEVMENDPAYRETVDNYTRFNDEHAVSTHSFSKSNLHESLEELKELPYNTPISVRFNNGTVLYAHSGNGLGGQPKNRFTRMLAKSGGASRFVQGFDDGQDRFKHVCFKDFEVMVRVSEIKEINVLKPGAYDKGFTPVQNSHVGAEAYKGEAPHREYGRWSVKGESYYFETEAANTTSTANVSEKARSRSWTSGKATLDVRIRPDEVREIKSPK